MSVAALTVTSCTEEGTPPMSPHIPVRDQRPAYHLTPPAHWMNDPQRPLLVRGEWQLYYLYNADFPGGNGTAWARATSVDLVTWKDAGVAIEKYVDDLGDVESGSAVVDEHDTAGLGAGAVVALATQQADGVQRQSLFVSHDDGRSFVAGPGNPVLDNPGAQDFRDSKVIRDVEADRWVMVLAEGARLGFYASTDLTTWTYLSDFATNDLGLLECPDLFEMALDGDSSRRSWVLLASANGAAQGRSTGTVYWTGRWADDAFTSDGHPPRWLDAGPDYYATVTWADPRESDDEQRTRRYALGWLNCWAYAAERSHQDWQGGAQSLVREIRLVSTLGPAPVLTSRPVQALDRLKHGVPATDPSRPATGSFHVGLKITAASQAGVELRLTGAAAAYVLRVDALTKLIGGRRVAMTRPSDELWESEHTATLLDAGGMELDVWVDVGSVEVFSADGSFAHSTAIDLGAPSSVKVEHDGAVQLHVRTITVAG